MVTSLTIKNFQSHKNTFIELCKGVNTFIGTSDHGKSSIARAFTLVHENTPSGDEFISHWAYDAKTEKLKDSTEVTIGLGDISVTRVKGKENKYEVNDIGFVEEYKAFGKNGVPEEVSSLLNLGETNIQRQEQNFFLFNETAGEVIRRINAYTNLDLIDEVLSKADKDLRANRSSVKTAQAQIDDVDAKLKAYEILDELEAEYDAAVEKGDALDANKVRNSQILSLLDSFDKLLQRIKDLGDPERTLRKIVRVESVLQSITDMRKQRDSVYGLTQTWDSLSAQIQSMNIVDASTEINKLLQVTAEIDVADERAYKIENLVKSYLSLNTQIKELPLGIDFSEAEALLGELNEMKAQGEARARMIRTYGVAQTEYENTCQVYNQLHEELHDALGDTCILCGSVLK